MELNEATPFYQTTKSKSEIMSDNFLNDLNLKIFSTRTSTFWHPPGGISKKCVYLTLNSAYLWLPYFWLKPVHLNLNIRKKNYIAYLFQSSLVIQTYACNIIYFRKCLRFLLSQHRNQTEIYGIQETYFWTHVSFNCWVLRKRRTRKIVVLNIPGSG